MIISDKEKFAFVASRLLRIVVYAISISVGLCIAVNKTFVNLWVGPELYAGKAFDIWMGLGMTALIFFFTIKRVLFSAGIIKGPSIAGALQNILRVVLLIPLILFLKLKGAGISYVFTFMLIGIIYFIKQWLLLLALKPSIFILELKAFLKIFLVSLILSVIFGYFIVKENWSWFIFNIFLYISVWLLVCYIIDRKFRNELMPLIMKVKKISMQLFIKV